LVKNIYGNWLLSLAYAYLFVYFIPWTSIYGQEFVDIFNYIFRIEYLATGGKEADYWGILWFTSEPLWKEIILFIGNYFNDYRAALYGVSFFTVFVYAYFLIKRVDFYIAMIFLINPMSVDFFISQLRNAVAFSILLIAYDIYDNNREKVIIPIFLAIMATFIHMSMPIFIAIYYILYRLDEKIEDKKYYLVALFMALIIAVLLSSIGDRHAGYDKYIAASSVAYSIAWFIIAMILATFAEFSNKYERILTAYAITVMGFYFFASLLNIFAVRYVTVIMPIIILSIGYLPKHIKQGTYLFLLLYNIYSFKYWLELVIL